MLYPLWFLVVTLGYFVKGTAGFGNSPIHTGLMAFFMNNADLTPVDYVLTAPANIALTVRHRKYLIPKLWIPGALITMAASVPGVLLLKNMDGRALKVLFGIVIALLGADMLRSKDPGRRPPPRWAVLTLTAVSGTVNGLFGIGVLLAAVMGRVIEDTRAFKANISAIFSAGSIAMLPVYLLTGLLTKDVFLRALSLYPAMALGLFLGIRFAGRLKEETVRKCAAVLLIACGIFLTAGNLR